MVLIRWTLLLRQQVQAQDKLRGAQCAAVIWSGGVAAALTPAVPAPVLVLRHPLHPLHRPRPH